MRSLTQVWVFFVSLTFLFLLLGFHLGGRLGLLGAFLLSLFFIYATLQRGISLMKNRLNAKSFSGNDPSGFLAEINKNKLKFGFRSVHVHCTDQPTPLLIWKNRRDEGHIVFNVMLLENLSPEEVRLLALLFLSHLEKRSFVLTPILSVLNQSYYRFLVIPSLLSILLTSLFNSSAAIHRADARFLQVADTSVFDAGFFLNRLHHFRFNRTERQLGAEYFSVLSIQKNWLNQYGIPALSERLQSIMGFSV